MTRVTKCVSGGVAASKSPVDLPLRLDERYRVAHNSTGPTSVSIDLEIRKGAGARPDDQLRQREHAGEATLDVSEHSPVRQSASHLVCRAAKALPWGHLASIRDAVLLRPVDAFSLRR